MPIIWKGANHMKRELKDWEFLALVAKMEKDGLLPRYPDRTDSCQPVLDTCTNLTIAVCRSKDKAVHKRILDQDPTVCTIKPKELESQPS